MRYGLFTVTENCAIQKLWYVLSRVSTPTPDTAIANQSVCPSVCLSVRDVPVSDENGLTYCHSFSLYGSPIILVLSAISRYISQTIQDSAIVTMEGE